MVGDGVEGFVRRFWNCLRREEERGGEDGIESVSAM